MRALIRLLVVLGLLLSAGSVSPLASAQPTVDPSGDPSASSSPAATDGPSPTSPASPSASPEQTASSVPSPSPTASATRKAAAGPLAPTTSITRRPANPSTDTTADFAYSADRPGVQFRCSLSGPGRTNAVGVCPTDLSQTDPAATSGRRTFTMAPHKNPYTLAVTAYYPAVTDPVTGAVVTPEVVGTTASYSWRVYSVYSVSHYGTYTGASFNNPLGTKEANRVNLRRVIRAINSMPGYRQALDGAPCPGLSSPALPSTIRITLYSMTDGVFSSAMRAAHRRCVSVQILMNNHLNRSNDPAWAGLEDALGTGVRNSKGQLRRSFAHRCSYGCRGSGVLHTKMYLFDSQLPAPSAGLNRINDTALMGSSNMTSNAAAIQWNDLYGVSNNATLYREYLSYFNLMKNDNGFRRNARDYGPSNYRTVFWPVAAGRTDPAIAALRSIRCTGVTGGTGINGRTVVYINMHAWFGLRGLAIQDQVRRLYSQGCYIRILYSFMTPKVHYRLTHGTNSRMSARRTIFSTNGDKYADVYSHFKNIAASGNVGGDRSARIVWTGSNNFTADGTHFDESMMRINSATAFRQYRDQFAFITRRKSSARYASFLEPVGGGRAPIQSPQGQLGTTFRSDTPVVISPDVIRDSSGEPKALD